MCVRFSFIPLSINGRTYKEYIVNNKSNSKYILILYFKGYDSDGIYSNIHTQKMNKLISNESKEYAKSLNKNILLVTLEGLYYYTNNSWNIVNNDIEYVKGVDGYNYRNLIYGTGTGYNSKNVTSCIGDSIKPVYYNQDPVERGGSAAGQCNGNFICMDDKVNGIEKCPKIDEKVKFSNCKWTSCADDIKFTKDIINLYKKKYDIDEIVSMGFSNGALFSFSLPNHIDEINTVITFAGGIPFGLYKPKNIKYKKILDFHGIYDVNIPGITSSTNSGMPCNDNEPSTWSNKELFSNMKQRYTELYNEDLTKNKYTCDVDPHNYLYHNLDDILSKITNKSKVKINKLNEERFGKVNENNNIKNIYKYNNDTYSIEWNGGHDIPVLNDADLLSLIINFIVK